MSYATDALGSIRPSERPTQRQCRRV